MNDRELKTERLDAGTLFRAHAPFIANFLARMGVSSQDVPDLVQEVFLVAHRRGGYLRGPARPTTWLAEIALRVASGARRTRRRRPEHLDSDGLEAMRSSGTSPAEAAANAESLRRLQAAIEELDPPRRAVFVLFELEGESCASIAAGLGIPVGTVYSRLHSARRLVIDRCEAMPAQPRHPAAPVTDLPAEPVRLREDDEAPEPARSDCKLAAAVPLVPFDVDREFARFEAAVGAELARGEAGAGSSATTEATASMGGGTWMTGWAAKLAGVGLAVTAGVGAYVGLADSAERAPEGTAEIERSLIDRSERTGEGAPERRPFADHAASDDAPRSPASDPDAGQPEQQAASRADAEAPAADDERERGRRTAQSTPSRDESVPPADSDPSDSLLREMRHLAETRAALTRSPSRALTLVRRARDRYPEPFYRQEWDALHIQALVGVGRRDEARTRFDAFVARYPKSPFRAQIERAMQEGL